jgi:uncharacterized protein (DUF433 family)
MNELVETTEVQPTVVRDDRGLMIAGTRLSLYHVMDYVKQDWPPKLIRDWLNLTDRQIQDIMAYIEEHREEVEAEYEEVLKQDEEVRRYWEERNRERLAQIAAGPPSPGQLAFRAMREELKRRRGRS